MLLLLRRKRFQDIFLGFSLLECIFALCLLLILLQEIFLVERNISTRLQQSHWRGIAILRAESLLARLQAYSAIQWEQQYQIWLEKSRKLLPKFQGHYQCHDRNLCTVHVSWRAQKMQTMSLSGVVN